MKINQLPMGARFLFEGEEYVKTGPMVAAGKSGQRLIPKYAVLKPLGEAQTEVIPASSETLLRVAVLQAFDSFYARCEKMVPEARRADLEAERRAFLNALVR